MMISHHKFSFLCLLQTYFSSSFSPWINHLVIKPLVRTIVESPLFFLFNCYLHKIGTIFPDPSVNLLVSNSVFLTISSIICFVCYSIESMIVLVFSSLEENSLLPISYCSWLIIVPFRDSISRFNLSISGIRRICRRMPVNSGVSFVLFQGLVICTNNIISLGMSLKIGDATKGYFSWSMVFSLPW